MPDWPRDGFEGSLVHSSGDPGQQRGEEPSRNLLGAFWEPSRLQGQQRGEGSRRAEGGRRGQAAASVAAALTAAAVSAALSPCPCPRPRRHHRTRRRPCLSAAANASLAPAPPLSNTSAHDVAQSLHEAGVTLSRNLRGSFEEASRSLLGGGARDARAAIADDRHLDRLARQAADGRLPRGRHGRGGSHRRGDCWLPQQVLPQARTLPRHFRDTSETLPRRFRDTSETLPRHFRGAS